MRHETLTAPSTLNRLCAAIVEAGWLVVVITTPLFVGVYFSHAIEPGKIMIVRVMAIVMAAAWLIQWFDRRARSTISLRAPLALPALILVAVYLIATVTSVAPRTSFFGAFPRAEGTYTTLSYIIVFALTAHGLRTRHQLDRLIAAIVLASLPVALYGLVQHFDLDPLAWSFASTERVGSTLGNPIFMSAYLIMVFTLTLGQIARSARDNTGRLVTFGYVAIAFTQTAAIVFSASRGPWLGGFVGVVLFILIAALALGKRRAALIGIGLGAAGLAFLVVLNLPGSPLAALRDLPGIGRFVNLTATDTAQVRASIWEGSARTAMPHAPLQYPDGTPDALNSIRPLIGYGPDTLYLVSGQFTPPDRFSREATIDRSHNETWDTLVNLGLAGLLAYQFLFASLFYFGLRRIDLITTRREGGLFAGLWIGAGLIAGLAVLLLSEVKYLGVALPIGNLAGLVAYLVIRAFRSNGRAPIQPDDAVVLAALLGGLAAHFVETQFGIAVAATRVTFWVFAAMLAALVSRRLEAAPNPLPSLRPIPASNGIIVALILAAMLNNFVMAASAISSAILMVLAATWIIGMAIIARKDFRVTAALSMILTLAFAIGLAMSVGALTPVNADQPAAVIGFYLAGLIGLALALAVLLFKEGRDAASAQARLNPRPMNWIALAPTALMAYLWINAVVLNPIRADIAHKMGQDLAAAEQTDQSIAFFGQAIRLAPGEDFYYTALGRALFSQAKLAITLDDAPASIFDDRTRLGDVMPIDAARLAGLNRMDLLYAAQALLIHARDLNPLYPDRSLNLARFYLPELPLDTPAREALADLSEQYFAEAGRLAPLNPAVWNERADFDLDYRNFPDAALQKLERSRALDPTFDRTYLQLGEAYSAKGDGASAVKAYRHALALNPALAEAYSRLAFLYYEHGQSADAIQAYLKYIELAPKASNVWEAHKNLALLYRDSGDRASAITHAETAARLAPDEARPLLDALVAQLRSQ